MTTNSPFFAPKTALITGASSGIGLELAHLFARDGYRLVLLSRNRSTLRQIADDLQARYSITVRIAPKDLAHPHAPAELYQELQEAGFLLDVLVNNAGFGLAGPFLSTDWAQEAEMMQVNMVAATHLTKLFLPQIRAREGGILNVASTAARVARPRGAGLWTLGTADRPARRRGGRFRLDRRRPDLFVSARHGDLPRCQSRRASRSPAD